MLIGYARVSTEDQTPLPQAQALKAAGCAEIHEEHASGGDRARPVLGRVLARVRKGDTLVVVRIDRLARSLSHLLEVIERLEAKGAAMAIFGAIDAIEPVQGFNLIFGRRTVGGSLIGGLPETQAMLDFCAEHDIVCDVEMIGMQDVNEAWRRVQAADVKYRFVIDMASLRGA